ncbi:hypothetical protein O181_077478 [Austropuccinia psidii MF-1]|uniref:Uncharacterized protein n=1 Tax=Austropuccinia psidii MF-1 TaxID=1389203 RepID=A0A9Q3FH08_9BASI|nr:hypothetical protein [Austropuccinia psidii MF-1]
MLSFNLTHSNTASEPFLPRKLPEVLSVNSSTPPSKCRRTSSATCKPIPGPSKIHKTPPPAYGQSVSFKAKKMNNTSSNHEDNNPTNNMVHQKHKLLTMLPPPKFQKKENSLSSSGPTPVKSCHNPIPEPCGTFAPQKDPILNLDSKKIIGSKGM